MKEAKIPKENCRGKWKDAGLVWGQWRNAKILDVISLICQAKILLNFSIPKNDFSARSKSFVEVTEIISPLSKQNFCNAHWLFCQ